MCVFVSFGFRTWAFFSHSSLLISHFNCSVELKRRELLFRSAYLRRNPRGAPLSRNNAVGGRRGRGTQASQPVRRAAGCLARGAPIDECASDGWRASRPIPPTGWEACVPLAPPPPNCIVLARDDSRIGGRSAKSCAVI